MKRKIGLNFIYIVFLFSLVFLSGCFSYELRAKSISIDKTTLPGEVTVDDFDLSTIKLLVERIDGSVDSISVTEDMLTNESLEKLTRSGTHNIYVRYDGKIAILSVKIVDEYSNIVLEFDTNGGSKISAQKLEKNSRPLRPLNPSKSGFEFDGWYSDKELTKEFDFTEKLLNNTTIYAKWVLSKNYITFETNHQNLLIAPATVETGKTLYEVTPKLDGYLFAGWYTDKALSEKYDFSKPVNKSFTLYAKWVLGQYDVSFETNGGTSIESVKVYHGDLLGEYTTIRKGYTFLGWYLDSEYLEKFDQNKAITSNITLYAKWEKSKVTISFETNGGTSIDDVSIPYGSILENNFTTTISEGTFLGWYLNKELTIIYDFSQEVVEDITIYAKWEMNDLVVNFEMNGGNSIESQTIKYGNKVQKPEKPKRLGYVFVGWCVSEELNQSFDFNSPIYKSTTIYAKWAIDTNVKDMYSIVIYDEDMQVLDAFKVEEGSDLTSLEPIVVEGKIFENWYMDSSFTQVYDLSIKIYTNMQIYAKYSDKFVVEYLDINGNLISKEEVARDKNANPPLAPIIDGYDFVGWDKDLSKVGGNITTKAVYEVHKYQVKFIIDGKEINTQKVTASSLPVMPTNISENIKAGYHFVSWDKEISPITSDTIYNAILEKNIYNVNYLDYFGNILFKDKVLHGEKVNKEKVVISSNYVVSNWYKNNSFTEGFDFSSPITSDTNIYGYFDLSENITYTVNGNEITITNFDLTLVKELVIPNSLNNKIIVSINNFTNYNSVEKIIISEKIKDLDIASINKMPLLRTIELLGENSFYKTIDGVLYSGDLKTILSYPSKKSGSSFILPSTVTNISNEAFYGVSEFLRINTNNLSQIDSLAFSNSNVISLSINHDGITKKSDSFANCSSDLRIIINKDYFSSYNSIWSDLSSYLYSTENIYNSFLYRINQDKVEIIEYIGNEAYVEIPEMISTLPVTKIKTSAFNSIFTLKGITLPTSLQEIEDNAFNNISLEYIKINSNITISDAYYLRLKDLFSETNVYVKDEYLSSYREKFNRCYPFSQIVGDYAYIINNGKYGILQYFGSLKEIVLPKYYLDGDIEFIDSNFIGAHSLERIYIDSLIEINALDINKNISFFVSDNYLEKYLQNDYAFYSNKLTIVEEENYVYGHYNNEVTIIKIKSKASEIIIPEYIEGMKVVEIGRYALLENEDIKTISVSSTLLKIGKNALKTEKENNIKIIFKGEIAPISEGEICYLSDEIYKTKYNHKGYGKEFNDHEIIVYGATLKTNDEYRYYISEDKVIITKYLINSKEVSIPKLIDGLMVVAVDHSAFENRIVVEKVILPESIEYIGSLAFKEMRNLKEIEINSLKIPYIEDIICDKAVFIKVNDNLVYRYRQNYNWQKHEVFSKNTNLIESDIFDYVVEDGKAIIIRAKAYEESLMITNKVDDIMIKKIGSKAFYDTGIINISINRQIEEIGYHALPETLRTLNLGYMNPVILQEQATDFVITVGDLYYQEFIDNEYYDKYQILVLGTKELNSSMFEYTERNGNITITKYLGNEKDVIIPEFISDSQVTEIGKEAFLNKDIETVTIPSSVTKIGKKAFYNCKNLVTINNASGVISIGEYAFEETKIVNGYFNTLVIGKVLYKYNSKYSLVDTYTVDNNILSIAPYAFENASSLRTIDFSNVLSIGKGAFLNCSNLINITIGDYVEKIEEDTFKNCTRLRNVELGKRVMSIESGAFLNCVLLESISLNNVEKIATFAFKDCKNISRISLPATLSKLESNAFLGCNMLQDITIQNSNYKIVDGILYDASGKILIEDLLKHKAREVAILATTEKISQKGFENSLITKISIYSDVSIENHAFKNNKNLESILFDSSELAIIAEESIDRNIKLILNDDLFKKAQNDYLYLEFNIQSFSGLK